jgi:hypothetical protein
LKNGLTPIYWDDGHTNDKETGIVLSVDAGVLQWCNISERNTVGESGNNKRADQFGEVLWFYNGSNSSCMVGRYIEDQTTYKLKDSWLARVSEVIGYIVDNGMYAIVNIYWDGGWLEEHPTYAYQKNVITKLSAL